MANIFEPNGGLGPFRRPDNEFQVNVDPTPDLDEDLIAENERETERRSFKLPIVVFMLALLVLTVRLIDLQISQGQIFQGLAKGNRVDIRRVKPPRGIIVDRVGAPLVKNIPVYGLNLYPAQLPKIKVDREIIYQKIANVTGLQEKDIIFLLDEKGLRSGQAIELKRNIDRDTALLWQVQLSQLAGVVVEQIPVRSYARDLALSHVIGYVGSVTDDDLAERDDLHLNSIIGKAGLEESYDRYLQGVEGREEMEVDSKGQIQRVVINEPPKPGKSLELYLNKELQRVMMEALLKGAGQADRKKGVAIALDPKTGGILGLVSLPDYDNNLFVDSEKKSERAELFVNADQPLFNRAIAGLYPPGSTVKPGWSVAALEERLITEKTDIQTPPEIRIGEFVFPDWKAHGHADVKKAIAESNNIFYYALSGGYDRIKGLGVDKMKSYAAKFGWNELTGIDIPGERAGVFPDQEWKRKKIKEPWYIGDTYHLGIGQGYMSLTPLQLIRSIAAIANDGVAYEPRLVAKIKDLNGNIIQEYQPKVTGERVGSSDTMRIVREGMRKTVLEGTAQPLKDISLPIAGKTGTSQFGVNDRTHAWFVGFAPFDDPTIALLVMVEGGGGSFEVAIPIAKDILSWYNDQAYTKSSP